MVRLVPIDFDPFEGESEGVRLVPVDFDPFDVAQEHARRRRAGTLPAPDPRDVAAEQRRQQRNLGQRPEEGQTPEVNRRLNRIGAGRATLEDVDWQERDRRREGRDSVIEDGPPAVRDTLAYIGTRIRQFRPDEYPWLFRRGRRITNGEINDLVAQSSERIAGMSPEDATRELFGRAEDRPSRRASVTGNLGTRQDAPEFQADPLNTDIENPATGATRRDREGWMDSGARRPLTMEQRADLAFEREVEEQRLSRFGEQGPGFAGGVGQKLLGVLQRTGGGIIGATGSVLETLGGETTGTNYLENLGRYVGERGRQRQAAANPGYEEWSPEWIAFETINATAEMTGALAVAAASRNPAAAASMLMGVRVGAERFDESIRIGRDPRAALVDATAYALMEAIPEKIALGRIMQSGGRFGEGILRRAGRASLTGFAAEGAQEILTETMQSGYDVGILNEDMTFGEALNRLAQAGIIGSLTGGVIGGGVGAVQGAAEHRQLRQMRDAGFDIDALNRTGIREGAETAPPPITPGDIASPLPTDLIAAGKAEAQSAVAATEADRILDEAIGHRAGDKISVTIGEETREGTIKDAFTEEDDELGPQEGVVIGWDDGSESRERVGDLRDSGARIERRPEGFSIRDYMAAARSAESGGNDSARNPRSSASGRYQFIDETFDAVFRQVYGRAPRPEERDDPAVQDRLMERFTRDNIAQLQRARIPINNGTVYAAHHFGAGGAISMARNPDAPVAAAIVEANPQLRGMTNGQALEWAARHVGSSGAAGDMGITDDSPAEEPNNEWITEGGLGMSDEAREEAPAAPAADLAPLSTESGVELPAMDDQGVVQGGGLADRFLRGGTRTFRTQRDAALFLTSNRLGGDFDIQPTENGRRFQLVRRERAGQAEGDGTRAAPVQATSAEHVDQAVAVAAEPTEAQKEAGNYQKGHVRVQGLDITIETPKGAERSGTDPDGNAWSVEMPAHYGYVKRTTGADEEQVDVYIGNSPDSGTVYIVDQLDAETGAFDEHKVMVGYANYEDAEADYRAAFSDGKGGARMGGVTEMSMPEFKAWLSEPQTGPAAAPVGEEASPEIAAALDAEIEEEGQPIGDTGWRYTMRGDGDAYVSKGSTQRRVVGPITDEKLQRVVGEIEQELARPVPQREPPTPLDPFINNPERALAALPDDQLAAVGQALGVRQGKGSRIALIERISANAKADIIAAVRTVIGGETVPKAGRFNPDDHIEALRAHVAKGGSLDPKTVATKLKIKPAQAKQALGLLASMPNSGLYTNKKGKIRRVAVARGPLDAIRFLRNGGVRDDEGHELMKSRNWHLSAPGLINRNGRPIDEAGRALWEVGYFTDRDPSDPSQRPTEAETIEFIENAMRSPAYTADDLEEVARREASAEDKKARANADYAIREVVEQHDLDLTADELADALEYMAAGDTAEIAVERAIREAGARSLLALDEETGNDFYGDFAESIYEGEIAEQRGDREGPEEGSLGPESVEAGEGQREEDRGEPAKAGRPVGTAPEHETVGVDDRELSEVVVSFDDVLKSQGTGDEQITHIFDPPAKSEIVRLNQKARVYQREHGWMTAEEAKAKIAEWRKHAEAQGQDPKDRSANVNRIVLSFFDLTGTWSQPWEDAGYQVWRFDIQNDPKDAAPEERMGDVNNFSPGFFDDWFGHFDGLDVYAILAACPCTDFAVSGARHFAAKDKDGRTVASVRLVQQTLAAIEYFKPAVWALENPVGRIESLGGLPPWRLSFDPWAVGEDYTKKTLIWGRFNADLPVAPRPGEKADGGQGSKMWSQYGGKSMATKNARSATPEGFAYSFFMANNAIDNLAMAISNKFDRLDAALIQKAVEAGVTEEQITTAVDDFYYMDLDDEAANEAIRALMPTPEPTDLLGQPVEHPRLKEAQVAARKAFPNRLNVQKAFVRGYLAELGDPTSKAALIDNDAEKDGARAARGTPAEPDADEGSLGLFADEAQTGETPEQQRQRAEVEARTQQSKARRDFQEGMGDQAGGLFGNDRTQSDIEPERSGDQAPTQPESPVEQAKAALQNALDLLNGKQPGEMIQDAGEKIGGARKDVWAQRGMNVADLEGMTQGEAFQLVTKDAVWPKIDYEALVEGGVSPDAAAGIKILRDSLAAKPREDSEEGRRNFIEMMQAAREILSNVRTAGDLEGVQQRLWDAAGMPTERGMSAYSSPEAKAARKKLFSIAKGNRFSFSIGYSERSKIRKMVEEGFPAKSEPWTRRYTVRRGRIYQDQTGEWTVWTKGDRRKRVGEFYETQAEAEAAAKTLYEGEDRTRERQPERPHLDRIQRSGEDVRGGRNIDSKDFLTDFGFRGVEFGNWVASDERQKSVNMAFEALHDLASVIGVPPRSLSLGGQLALAFGARGKGKAAAHYEPGKLVINLTKMSGAGSLAHEWGHALDHYFGTLDTDLGTRGAPKGASGWMDRTESRLAALGNLRPEMAAAFDNLMTTIFKRDLTRAEQIRNVEQNIEKSEAGIAQQRERIAETEKQIEQASTDYAKRAYGRYIKQSEQWIADRERVLNLQRERLTNLRDETKPVSPIRAATDYAAKSEKLPGKQAGKPYWTQPTEMLARSFEAYVFDKIRAGGNVSQYLVQGVEEEGDFAKAAYPTGEERKAINAAYDRLFETMGVRGDASLPMLHEDRLGFVPEGVAEPSEQFDMWSYVRNHFNGRSSQDVRGDSPTVPPGRGGRIRALGIANDLRREGATALVGRTVSNPGELAALAQVFRDPRFETFRVFFMKGETIVHSTGVSSRMPGVTPLLPRDAPIKEWLTENMEAFGADGYYLLHNHPSGDPAPSRQDLRVTEQIADAVPGFLSHVVINSNKYAEIPARGSWHVFEKDFGEDKLLKASVPNPVNGQAVQHAHELAAVGKMVQLPGYVTLIAADARLTVRAVVDYPESSLRRPPAILMGAVRRLMRLSGSTNVFLVGSRESLQTEAVRQGIMRQILTEAIDHEGEFSGLFGHKIPGWKPAAFGDGKGAFVAEDGPQYQRRLTDGDDPVFYSALERAVEASTTKRASAGQWAATLSKVPGVKKEELEWSGLFDWLDMQEGPVSRDDLLGVIRDGGIQVEEVVLGGKPSIIPESEIDDAAEAAVQEAADEIDFQNEEQRQDWVNSNYGRYRDAAESRLEREDANDAQFESWSSDPSNPTYRELLITLPVAQGGNPERAPATHWDQPAVVAHARFMDKTDAEGKRVLFIEEVQSDWHQKGRDEGYEKTLSAEEMAARDQALAEATKGEIDAANDLIETVRATASKWAETWPKVVPGNMSIAELDREIEEFLAERSYDVSYRASLAFRLALQLRRATSDPVAQREEDAWNDARLKRIEAEQAASRRAEGSIPDAPFKSSWPALVMKRLVRWASDHSTPASPAFAEVTKPDSAGVIANDFFGSREGTVPPLQAVDAGVISALQNDKVRRAVISDLPVDVVNILGRQKRSADDLLRNPNVVVATFPVDQRRAVFDGLLGALRSVGARLRAELTAARAGGRDAELLPALKASELDPSIIVGLLSPQLRYHDAALLGAGGAGVAGAPAVAPTTGLRGVGERHLDAAALADFLNWHDRLRGGTGNSYQAPTGYDKIAWTTGEEQAERYNLASHIKSIRSYSTPEQDGRVKVYFMVRSGNDRSVTQQLAEQGYGEYDYASNMWIASRADLEAALGKDLGGRVYEAGIKAEPNVPAEIDGEGLKIGGEGMRQFYDRNLVNMTNDLIKKYGGKVGRVEIESDEAPNVKKTEDDEWRRLDVFLRDAFEARRQIIRRIADEVPGQTRNAEEIRINTDPRYLEAHAEYTRARAAIMAREDELVKEAKQKGEVKPGFEITDQLRDAARSGFPLFALNQAKGRPLSDEQVAEIAERLHAELDRLGISDRIALKVANGLLADKGAQGAYFRRMIQVAADMALNPAATFNHEAVHAMRNLGLFTPSEWTALVKAARADEGVREFIKRGGYGKLTPEKLDEEHVAEFFSRWRTERMEAKGFAAKAFQRLLDFMHALGRAVAVIRRKEIGAGTVMRRIEKGKIGRRETNAGALAEEPMLQESDDGFTFDPVQPERSMTQRQRAELEARQQQSKIRRANQHNFGAEGPLFGQQEEQDTLFQKRVPAALWNDMLNRKRTLTGAAKTPGRVDAIQEGIERLRTNFQDRMLPILKTQTAIEQVIGRELSEEEQPYRQEALFTGRVGAQFDKLEADLVAPLFEAMKEEAVDLDELESYLYARHAPSRNAKLKKEGVIDGSGMTDIEAAAIMARVDKSNRRAGLEAVAARVDKIVEFALQTRVDAGLISQEDADDLRSQWKHYVPLRGFLEMPEDERPVIGKGLSVKGPESKRAFGRKSQADDILAHVLMQAEEAIVRAEKNLVAVELYNLAKANPDKNFWTTQAVKMRKRINKDTGQVESYAVTGEQADDPLLTVNAKIDGKVKRVTFNRQNRAAVKAAAAMRRTNDPELNVRALQIVNQWLSKANTALNPDFVFRNAFRDLETATANLSSFDMKGLRRDVVKSYPQALKAATKGAFGGESTTEWDQAWHEFTDEGGRVYYNQVQDLDALKKDIEARFKKLSRQRGVKQAGVAMWEGLKWTFDKIEKLNLGVENAVRLSVYKNMRDRGVSQKQAAFVAKEITVNFNRRGVYGVLMNSLYLFYNASTQGSVRMLLALKHPKTQKIAAGMVVVGALNTIFNAMASGGGDDDEESAYDRISEYEKSTNLIFMIPGTERYVKIPVAYGYNIFFELGRHFVDVARGHTQPLDAAGSWLFTAVNSFNPIGGQESISNLLAPTIADPFVDIFGDNRDYADRPIMPEDNPFARAPTPDNQRYWPNVNPAFRSFTDALNRGTGGDDVLPGWADVSPETLEYMTQYVTGAAGATIMRAGGGIGKALDGDPETALELNDVPVARTLVGAPQSWYPRAAFNERLRHVEEVVTRAREYRANADREGLRAYVESEEDVLRLRGAARQARKAMREIRRDRARLDVALERGRITEEQRRERRAALHAREERLFERFNSVYLETVEEPRRPQR